MNAAPEKEKAQAQDKLFMENTLLRVAGALFCHDAKRAAKNTGTIELNRGVKEKSIVIRPDPELGQPGPLAHKIFVALLKKHSDYGRPIQKEISFTQRELGRLIGRKVWGGKDSEQLSRALHEIHFTFIKAHFRNKTGRFIEQSFNIFPEILIERREFLSDPIEACTIMLAEPIVASLQDEHFTCLNHGLMTRLGTIGQALYMRSFFHFANLYDGRNKSKLSFKKRYDDICSEWLGGLTVLRHKSKIVGEQLGPHLDQLVAEGVLTSYTVAKSANSDDFIVSFRPGETFFRDYDRFYRNRKQGELQFEFHGEQREISEPLRVAQLFVAKRTGQPVGQIASFPSKDVSTAKEILQVIPFAEVADFIDYALAEAKRTNFDVQTLGGIRQYLAGYQATKDARKSAKAQAAKASQERESEAEQDAYDRFTRSEARRIYETLTPEEREAIDAEASGRAASFSGSLRKMMTDRKREEIVIERHRAAIRTFEDWRADR
ncbi:replication initiator protein A [Methylocystis sp. WRRC1]|uniref:replication initiator protein A n=1 Tax=Methylocystis sp. WRRC1 TaxID=1732014 RepID=UPI001D14D69A|nr:replication initiator protein A [Methylocystis sp. WRRC1]MCC3246420.1 replication initiator protein A [Methylocystis sp. WRRC1]